MTIGTAVPSNEELAQAEHYFIQNKSIHDPYSVGDFEKEALAVIDQLFEKKDVVIVVGGSALYENALTQGLDELPDIPGTIKSEIQSDFLKNGLEWLQNQVQEIDPEFYSNVDIKNPRRLLRALEVYRATGIKLSHLQSKKSKQRDFNIIKIGLEANRDILYERINQRVDIMINEGLEEEARSLHPYKTLPALLTVGYQEFFPYFDGDYDKLEAVRLVKRNTRRFAKRQLTWYRKDSTVHFFPYQTRHTLIVQRVDKLMENNNN